ncbi:MAG: OadG family protein [Sulfurovum sp.]|nr:OadG family protein [Sulfurovum sp.]MCB4745490.1 OadG family protein [Sulfurovum sp.]MCB4745614.1 OadG family protein [Sulfurovum sp.]MCB4748285.1 OadG family protein [Sulfurovum sp.]MCB4748485.1 OadG family protein [Sulfurovum sp.]
MEYSLVGEALKFMMLGMLIVFIFLLVLVQVMKLQAKIINKYFLEKTPEVSTSSLQSDQTQDTHHIAAIVATIAEFRKDKYK